MPYTSRHQENTGFPNNLFKCLTRTDLSGVNLMFLISFETDWELKSKVSMHSIVIFNWWQRVYVDLYSLNNKNIL